MHQQMPKYIFSLSTLLPNYEFLMNLLTFCILHIIALGSRETQDPDLSWYISFIVFYCSFLLFTYHYHRQCNYGLTAMNSYQYQEWEQWWWTTTSHWWDKIEHLPKSVHHHLNINQLLPWHHYHSIQQWGRGLDWEDLTDGLEMHT